MTGTRPVLHRSSENIWDTDDGYTVMRSRPSVNGKYRYIAYAPKERVDSVGNRAVLCYETSSLDRADNRIHLDRMEHARKTVPFTWVWGVEEYVARQAMIETIQDYLAQELSDHEHNLGLITSPEGHQHQLIIKVEISRFPFTGKEPGNDGDQR